MLGPRRFASGLVSLIALGALGLVILVPLPDHHWMERVPGHQHIALSAAFDPQHHVHSYASDHTRATLGDGQHGTQTYLAVSDWDGSSPEAVTTLAGPSVIDGDILLAPPLVFVTTPLSESTFLAGYSPFLRSPPSRSTL